MPASPEARSGRADNNHSADTIYQACYQGLGLFAGRGGIWCAAGPAGDAGAAARPRAATFWATSSNVSALPAAAAERTEAGHREGDLVKGPMNRSGVVTLVERLSRFCLVGELIGDCGADATRQAIGRLLARVPRPLRRSLTWDQGREMADWERLAADWRLPVYFCDPQDLHSPWQRPTNEHTNGLLRRWMPDISRGPI